MMRIAGAACFRYALPFTTPLTVGGEKVSIRRGLLLRLETTEGQTGWGEAAPLRGVSPGSLAEVASALVRVAEAVPDTEAADPWTEGETGTDLAEQAPPSVRFAVESALLELAATRRGETVAQRLGARATVDLNGLIPADTEAVADAADAYEARGFRTVKLKVGRRGIDEDVRRVHVLTEALDKEGRIRLDANRAWTMEEACSFAEALGEVPLEYIEEPLVDPERLPAFADQTGLPVALDETTREWAPDDLSEERPFAAVVLKPTLLGRLATLKEWARAARAAEAVPVVSAAYESGVGMQMLAALAASLSEAAAGLSTYERLDVDVLAPRLSMAGPTVDVAAMAESDIDRGQLERIPIRD